jgi:hypothetical protein
MIRFFTSAMLFQTIDCNYAGEPRKEGGNNAYDTWWIHRSLDEEIADNFQKASQTSSMRRMA